MTNACVYNISFLYVRNSLSTYIMIVISINKIRII